MGTFTLLCFWSNWTQLEALARTIGPTQVALALLTVLIGSSVLRAVWEFGRAWLPSFQFENEPFLQSRYVRTVRDTALAAIALAVIALMNFPAPDIVYRKF